MVESGCKWKNMAKKEGVADKILQKLEKISPASNISDEQVNN